MDMDKLEFDSLEPKEVPVRLGQGEYVLTEASAGAAAAYENRKMKGAVLGEDGTFARIENLADLGPLAVSLCLFRGRGQDREPVTEEWVRSLPDTVVDRLLDAVRVLSPTLFGRSSLEELHKQHARLAKTIADLEAKKGDPKDSPAGTSPSSSTAAS